MIVVFQYSFRDRKKSFVGFRSLHLKPSRSHFRALYFSLTLLIAVTLARVAHSWFEQHGHKISTKKSPFS
jgi:hypothetical protein